MIELNQSRLCVVVRVLGQVDHTGSEESSPSAASPKTSSFDGEVYCCLKLRYRYLCRRRRSHWPIMAIERDDASLIAGHLAV